MFKRWT